MDKQPTYTEEEVRILKESPYITDATRNMITYGEVFHRELYRLLNQGYNRREAVRFLGFPDSIITTERVKKIVSANKKYIEERKESFQYENLTQELEALRSEVEYLRQETEFLKKKEAIQNNHLKKKL